MPEALRFTDPGIVFAGGSAVERVPLRGEWVALVADGALGAHKRVALTLNSER